MNQVDYITSGILQDYCLGFLSAEEEKKVEAMCLAFTEVSLELKALQVALQKFTNTNKAIHRNELRKVVWKAVKKLWEETQ
jgi:anti-sigma-K factor RskA